MSRLKTILLSSLCLLFVSLGAENKSEEIREITSVELLGCNPLRGFNSFAIHPQYSITSLSLRSKVNEIVEHEFKKIGNVFTLKVPDTTGYGKSQANITMLFEEAPSYKGSKISISDLALLISSSTIIEKTDAKCSTYIWTSHTFIDGSIDDKNEKNILDSVNRVIGKFINEYQEVNKDQTSKPTFYLYKP